MEPDSERRSKRPRLSIFAAHDDDHDTELEDARIQNDLSLKSRFEQIFSKYEHDFEGIGDEIDLQTGEIVVNNGHLEAIVSETDTGKTDGYTGGRSLLQAITFDEKDEGQSGLEDGDEVLMSIEKIAESAAEVIDLLDDESEDELFAVEDPVLVKEEELSMAEEDDIFSETDSLFAEETRFSSPDSLFEMGGTGSAKPPPQTVGVLEQVHDNAVLARFGSRIGQEVLDLIEMRKQAAIEPVWRVPIEIVGPRLSTPRSRSRSHSRSLLSSPPFQTRAETINLPSAYRRSIWKAPKRKTKARPKSPVDRRRMRNDSIDPLQEDFCHTNRQEVSLETGDHDSDPDYGDKREDDDDELGDEHHHRNISDWSTESSEISFGSAVNNEELQQILDSKKCPFCQRAYITRLALIGHWRRTLRKYRDTEEEGGVHDMQFLRSVKVVNLRPDRGPRLLISDFRTMVEMHDGFGSSFEDIANSQTLTAQTKSATQLQDLYDRYRSSVDDPLEQYEWSFEDVDLLTNLSTKQNLTMAGLRSRLKRDGVEIGDKLAEIWLTELRTKSVLNNLPPEADPPEQQANNKQQTANSSSPRMHLIKPVRRTDLRLPPGPNELIKPTKQSVEVVHTGLYMLPQSTTALTHPLAIPPIANHLDQLQPAMNDKHPPPIANTKKPTYSPRLKSEDSDQELFGNALGHS